jgi:Group II intron, maturase-specific domain
MKSVTRFITQRLKLKVNETKSAVARPGERKFLGFSFQIGREVKRVIAPKALDRFKQRIREITRRAKGVSLETTIAELAPYIRAGAAISASAKHLKCWCTSPAGSACDSGLRCGGSGKPSPPPGGPVAPGGASPLGEQHRRLRARPLVSRAVDGPLCGAFQCILQIARIPALIDGC